MRGNRLRFNGSLWCNLDIARHRVRHVYDQTAAPLGLGVIEWYAVRALYERDGQHATDLARAVGRTATSFTHLLDRLEQKEFVKRQPDLNDRRAIYIYLTEKAQAMREQITTEANRLDARIQQLVSPEEWAVFVRVLARLQQLQHKIVE